MAIPFYHALWIDSDTSVLVKLNKGWDWVWVGDDSFKGYGSSVSGRGAASCFSGKSPNVFSAFFVCSWKDSGVFYFVELVIF